MNIKKKYNFMKSIITKRLATFSTNKMINMKSFTKCSYASLKIFIFILNKLINTSRIGPLQYAQRGEKRS